MIGWPGRVVGKPRVVGLSSARGDVYGWAVYFEARDGRGCTGVSRISLIRRTWQEAVEAAVKVAQWW